jgi:peptide/nickel transport system substrate-binding protein
MKNRLMMVLGMLIVVSMVLAACGPAEAPTTDEPTAPTEAPSVAQPTEEAPPPTPEPTAVPRTTRVGGWLDTVTMVVVTTDAVITQLQAGEIDLYANTLATPQEFQAAQSAGMQTFQPFGLYYEITFNPAGPVLSVAGTLNPFGVPAVREAMNKLIDRNYLVQEIYGGLAAPKWFPITGAFPDYARYADVAAGLEAEYAYDFDAAKATIDAEMTAMGAEMVDGKWNYNGEPVNLIFVIRSDGDGTRIQIGDYVSNQLEDIGFTVTRDYKTASEASPIWNGTNPEEGQWHLYTGGWITTIVSRDQGGNFLFFYTPDGSGSPLWQAYRPTEEFYAVSQALNNNNFANFDERRELFATAMDLGLEDSSRVWLVDQKSFSPYSADVEVTGDLAGGISAAQLQFFTLRFKGQEGGDLTYAMADLLVEPWNPVGGSNWVYDTAPKRGINDFAVFSDPYTGLAWPQRIDTAAVTLEEGLPVAQTLDWVTLDFAAEIPVPEDAWADWDAETQTFITAAERFPEGTTAKRKTVVTYPADFFEQTVWHDGSNFSPADFVMFWIMQFDTAKEASAIYDPAAVSLFNTFLPDFKGLRITSTDPFTIEFYSDTYQLDAELNITALSTLWPEYGFGNAPWHMIAIGNLAEAGGELAYTVDKADANGVEWTNYIDGPSLEVLGRYLDQAEAESHIPYAATLGEFLSAEEAAARYANLKAWFADHNHYWVGVGPYMLDRVFSVEKTLTMVQNPNYQDLSDKWARFAAPKVAEVEVDGEGRVTIGQEALFDVFVTFEGEPYPADEIAEVKYLLFDATGAVAGTGNAELVSDGQYLITLEANTTSALAAGANRLQVVVISNLVSTPTFAPFEFVTAP